MQNNLLFAVLVEMYNYTPLENAGSYVPPSAPPPSPVQHTMVDIDDYNQYPVPVKLTVQYEEEEQLQLQRPQQENTPLRDNCLWWISCLFCCIDNR